MNPPNCPLCGVRPILSGGDLYCCITLNCPLVGRPFEHSDWLKICHAEKPPDPKPELLPCPFCGHQAAMPFDILENLGGIGQKMNHLHFVRCDKCGGRGPMMQDDARAARKAWNDRKGPKVPFTGHFDIPPKLAEALRKWRGSSHAGCDCPVTTQLRSAIDSEPLFNPPEPEG